jgi:hypothetical protein
MTKPRPVLPRTRPHRGLPFVRGVPARAVLAAVLVMAALCLPGARAAASPAGQAVQELRIDLDPRTGRIEGRSVLRLPAGSGVPDILLHPRMTVKSVRLGGRAADFRFEGGILRIAPTPGAKAADISLEYAGSFPEPVPTPQFGSDNPGFGVEASITPRGVFLQGRSGWYPHPVGADPSVNLEVRAPLGFPAVTSGRLLGHEDRGGRTVSRWEVRRTERGIPLSAGPYVRERLDAEPVPVMTYLFPDNAALSRTYLEASARHLATYVRLLGPYPFEHFAVVENFFPTGYGMPSYTLLGSTVLRLPFIPETSLRHEVVHCWYGNGVLVDYARGNWSEGLTTYLADHMAQEEASAGAAREYRLRALRDYAQLAAGRRDFPLSRFVSRSDPATQAVGYGKAMFVVHMIRQRLGDESFRGGLRDFTRQWLFREASWRDMFAAFEGQGWDAGESATFLRQWVLEPGAPDLALEDAEIRPLGGEWEVDGVLRQKGSAYALRVPVRLETDAGPLEIVVPLDGPRTSFTIASPHRPRRLTADPDVHVFRLLAPSEIPPTVNSIKGSGSLAAVVAEEMRGISRDTVAAFLSSLNQPDARVLSESQAEEAGLSEGDILFFGYPRSPRLRELVAPPRDYGLAPGGEWFDAATHPEAQRLDAIFVTVPDARGGGGVTALFRTRPELDEAAVIDAARRGTHYGKESYLGFEGGRNRLRGAWPPLRSPLTVEFAP